MFISFVVWFFSGKPSDDPGSPSYIPSIFSFTSQAKQSRRVEDRYERLIKRRTPAPVEPINENVQLAADALLDLQNAPLFCDRGTDPDPDPLEANLRALGVQYAELQDEHKGLQENVRKGRFTYTNLNNEQMRNLTGLKSCALFLWVLSLISMFIKPVGKICPGDQLLLVLMKLRLSLTNADLAIRFKICPTIVSKIFSKCLPVISQNLKFLIEWPSKAKVLKNMPSCFKHKYKNCRVIIDCTEVFIQRPANLDTRQVCYSNYKSHNTIKFLVGITPYGTVSFLSQMWGGRISDKELTIQSGFLEKLEYGDVVLADGGFLISEELAIYGASLAIPPFTRGKKQLSMKEVETARRLSRVRIHVERAIERIKNFRILQPTMQISLVRHADDIVTVCAALTNLMGRLVK
uniref:DDE Tnp4 domain-containing protein n=1 Tax=Neogobius melanostomus TaxID=47308 RepID=A0A8C6UUF1_9GOBI